MAQVFSNNGTSTLAFGITAADTTLTIQAGHGVRFPVVAGSDHSFGTLEDAAGNIEIVRVTAHASGSSAFTVQRAQQGTTARSWGAGAVFDLRPTAAEAANAESAFAQVEAARGAAASLAVAVVRYAAGLLSNLAAGGYKITGLGTPTDANDAATKGYVDAAAISANLPAQAGNDGKVVRSDGAVADWADAWGPPVALSAAGVLAARTAYHATTAGGAFTVSLPASPAPGDWVLIRDVANNNHLANLTLARNGSNVYGAAQDYIMDVGGESLMMVCDATQGWVRG